MNRRDFLATGTTLTAAAALPTLSTDLHAQPALSDMTDTTASAPRATRKILIAGGGFRTKFIGLMAQLSGKPRARVCFLPTASADSEQAIIGFYQSCAPVNVEPFV